MLYLSLQLLRNRGLYVYKYPQQLDIYQVGLNMQQLVQEPICGHGSPGVPEKLHSFAK